MKKTLLLLILALLLSFTSQSTIINVPASFLSIQAAINSTVNGDTVLVEPGTYFENLNFRGRNIVLTSRYYVNNDTAYISTTIINGSQPTNVDTASCVIFNSGEDSTAILQGFTLTAGTGTKWLDIHGAGTYREGGGIITELSSPTIQNNLIIYNTTSIGVGVQSAGGGGIRIGDGNPIIRNNVIAFNTGRYGAGIVLNYTNVLIENNLICYNSGGQDYGGAGIWASNNFAGYNKKIINNTIANNHSTTSGGGIYISGTNVVLKNNILWGNTAALLQFSQIKLANGGTVQGSYNDVQVTLTGSGNINTDPYFTDSISFYLPPSVSLAVDAGDSSTIYNDLEDAANPGLALFPSVVSLRNDMGVYGGPKAKLLPVLHFIPVGISENQLLESSLLIYPNPIGTQIKISLKLEKPVELHLKLMDISGEDLKDLDVPKESTESCLVTMDVHEIPAGNYILSLSTEEYTVYRKVVIR